MLMNGVDWPKESEIYMVTGRSVESSHREIDMDQIRI
jgi:hypothetical protein